MDTDYSRLESELKAATFSFAMIQMGPHSEVQLKQAQNRLIAKLSTLDIPAVERRHPKSYLYWLMEKYIDAPLKKNIENLSTLKIINYKLTEKNKAGLSLINYLVNHTDNIKLLECYFTLCPGNIIEFSDPCHPLLRANIEDNLFRFLVVNFDKYNASDLTPLNFAIAKGNQRLVAKILQFFPEMLYAFSSEGINALTQAIFTASEEMLDFILSYNPPVDFRNLRLNSLAHLVFLVKEKMFLEKIIFEAKYAVLNLQSQIASETLRNACRQLPMFCALNNAHYAIFEHLLTCTPTLKTEFPHIMLGLIRTAEHHGLDYLYRHHQFSPIVTPEFFSKFTNTFLSFREYHLIEWFSQLDALDVHNKKAFNLLQAIIIQDISKIRELLSDISISWNSLLPIIPWKVTELLIERGRGNLITEYDLFERCDSFIFQHDDAPQENFLNFLTIQEISALEIKVSPIYQTLVEYFCTYLNRHQAKYPGWVNIFCDPIFFVHTFLRQYQIEVYDEPLLHYFESYVFNGADRIPAIIQQLLNPTPQAINEALFDFYKRNMSQLISYGQIDLNVKDKAGLHLFAKLIHTNQLQRINYLKTQFPEITLEKLDPLGSNLLHLACQNNYLETVKWCIINEMDLHQVRRFDSRLPIEIAFENLHMDIVNYLRKLVTRASFIDVLRHLIRNGNDALIHYILENGFFSFKLTPHHLGLIKSLSHPILERFFNHAEVEKHKASEEAIVAVKPSEERQEETLLPVQELKQANDTPKKTDALNQIALSAYRGLLQKTSLENLNNLTKILKQDIYHEPLRVIFGENILAYAEKIVSSENAGLIKQFFKIAIVNELMNADENWYHLINRISPEIKSYTLSLICEQEIAKAQISSHLPELITADISSIDVFKFYASTFSFSSDTLSRLVSFSLESGNIDLLSELLKNKQTIVTLLDSPISTLMSSFEQTEAFSQYLLNLPIFLDYLAAENNIILKHAIYLNKPAIIKILLQQTSVRTQFVKTGFAVIQEMMSNYQEELFPLFIEHQDLETLLGQFPAILSLIQKQSNKHHPMELRLPMLVHIEELFNAIKTANLEALQALYLSIRVSPKLIEELLCLSVSCRNIEALKFLVKCNLMYFHSQFGLMKSLLMTAIHERELQIFKYIVDCVQAQHLNLLLDINVFKYALSGDNLDIVIDMLKYRFIQKHAHKFNQLTLKKAIIHQHIELIDFLLELRNVKSKLLGNCETLIKEALKQSNPNILFHLLLNNIIFVNSIQNQQLTPEQLMNFTDFFIKNYKKQRSMSADNLETIELMQRTEALRPFHSELRKLKEPIFNEKHHQRK